MQNCSLVQQYQLNLVLGSRYTQVEQLTVSALDYTSLFVFQEYSEEDSKVLGDVQRQVVMSYCTSAQEMTGLLGNKLRYLSSLKL